MGTLPKRSILSAWFGRLPEEKAAVYDACATELDYGFNELSIALNEGLRLRELGHLRGAREAAALCWQLAERHTRLLESVLRVMQQESRHLAALPEALPFEVEAFRTGAARSTCFWYGLFHRALFSSRTRWFHKLHSLEEILSDISRKFLRATEEVSGGYSLTPLAEWEALEELYYDWNTCLLETMILLKCLLDIAEPRELSGLRRELGALAAQAAQPPPERPTVQGEGMECRDSRTPERPAI